MNQLFHWPVFAWMALVAGCSTSTPPPHLRAMDVPLKSSGTATVDGSWAFSQPGYLGVYIRTDKPQTVSISVEPASVVSIAGRKSGPASHSRFDLPAGTFLLTVESSAGQALVKSLDIRGATVLAGNTPESALAAADTYIQQGRKSTVTLSLPGLSPGTPIEVHQLRPAFLFGANASGSSNVLLASNAPVDSDAARFRSFFPEHFNAVVPSNTGKWAYHESSPGVIGGPGLDYLDAILAFAAASHLTVRMHNMIWDTGQQPQYAQDLLTKAEKGDAAAQAELRQAISRRINYYVRQRAARYQELDVLNESLHRPRYVQVYGLSGVADIYREVADVLVEVSPNTKTYLNEYNVIQYSQEPLAPKPTHPPADPFDHYANWYRRHAEVLNVRGAKIRGIGVQFYVDTRPAVADPYSAEKVYQVFTNLAGTGLPITLTEFGIKAGGDEATNARIMSENLRLAYGHPGVTGFMFFGFWSKSMWDQAPAAVLADDNFHLTSLGKVYADLRTSWSTHISAAVRPDQTLTFSGFHGDYELLAAGRRYTFSIGPDTRAVTVNPPKQ